METVRYFKLMNQGAFVAQIVIEYKERYVDAQGNVSYDAEWKTWYTEGYRDILQYAERTVDLMMDSPIPDGSQVRLYAYVGLGNSLTSTDQYIYQKKSAHMAVYEISGTTLNDELVRVSFG